MEADHGSLFRALLHTARTSNGSGDDSARGASRGIFSFRDGLHTLPAALADTLDDVQLNAPVTALRQDETRWHVATRTEDGATQMHFFDAVICTVPLHRLPELDFNTGVDLRPLEEVPYPPVSVLALGFRESDVEHPLDGFGMLVPSTEEEMRILGTIFSSTLFPGRAPDGEVLLTTFVGGMREPELGRLNTSALRPIVENDLEALLGVRGDPTFVRRVTWERAIPQYVLGYDRVKDTLDRLESEHPGLYFAGNYRQGISVGDAMTSGAHAAHRARHSLQSAIAADG
jgi:oxygen-dependent protoporphyrinogen oxidase